MSRIFIFLFVLLSFFENSYAQSFEKDYKLIRSEGQLPEEFTFAASVAARNEIINIDSKQSRRSQKLNKKLVVFTNFDLNDLFTSGYILINDTISAFVKQVANQVIQKEPELTGKLKIYVIKSTDANAYCFENGTVFVNIGLIARLDNEAELAYILSHEFVHYIKKHSLQRIVAFDKIDRQKSWRNGYQDKVLLKYQFSKENETEADTVGLTVFGKTDYNIQQPFAALKLLQHSEQPFDTLTFQKQFFEDEHYKLPADFFLKSFNPLTTEENIDDSYQTHPDIIKREKYIDDLATKNYAPQKGKKYIVSETSFNYIREISRFECCRMLLVERNYIDAFKCAYLLKQKCPENLYLNKTIAKCLYALTLSKTGNLKFDENSFHNNAIPDYTKIEGSSQQVNYFFDKIPANDLAVLATRFLWQNHLKYPDDNWFYNTSDTLMNLLFSKTTIRPGEFNRTNTVDSVFTNYYSSAFTKFFNDTNFLTLFDSASKKYPNNAHKASTPELNKFEFSDIDKKEIHKNKASEYISPADLKKILIINPYYEYNVDNDYDVTHLLTAEKNRNKVLKFVQKDLGKKNVSFELIDPSLFRTSDIENYNEYGDINLWVNERIDAGLENCNPIFGTDSITGIVKNHEAKYGLLVSVKSEKLKNPKGVKLMMLYGWGWLGFPIPILVYQMIVPPKHIEGNISLVNFETGEIIKTKKYSGDYRNPNSHIRHFTKKFIKKM